MVEVTVETRVNIGARSFPVKGVKPFLTEIADSYVKATAVQLRILAYSTRDLIIDKILAQEPLLGKKKVKRVPLSRIQEVPPAPKEEQALEPDVYVDEEAFKRGEVLPPHYMGPPEVKRQPFKFPELSRDYLRRKIAKGLDARALVASGDYLRGIVIRKRIDPERGVTYVVSMANRNHRNTNLPLKTLARLMEYGTRAFTISLFGDENHKVTVKLPARPHWIPAFEEIRSTLYTLGPDVQARVLRSNLDKLE